MTRVNRDSQTNTTSRLVRVIAVIGLCCLMGASAAAQSAVDVLGRFDAATLADLHPIESTDDVGEMAKLIYRLARVSEKAMIDRVIAIEAGADALVIGDAARIDGQVIARKTYRVPRRLVEFLEFETFDRLTIEQATSAGGEGDLVAIYCAAMPDDLAIGDRVGGVCVVLSNADDPSLYGLVGAAGDFSWQPVAPELAGWRMLGDTGFDVGQFREIRSRNRLKLGAVDQQSFYSMLAAAGALSAGNVQPGPKSPRTPDLATLLSKSSEMVGDWIRVRAETVRVTRVQVPGEVPATNPAFDATHYSQIDAIGDLGDVQLVIQPNDADQVPLVFENRFPISVLIMDLPPSLKDLVTQEVGGDAATVAFRRSIEIDGFLYRLWSYTSDLSQRQNSPDQFVPLIMATHIRLPAVNSTDPIGVSRIGWVACSLILLGIGTAWLWHFRNQRTDREVRRRQPPAQIQ